MIEAVTTRGGGCPGLAGFLDRQTDLAEGATLPTRLTARGPASLGQTTRFGQIAYWNGKRGLQIVRLRALGASRAADTHVRCVQCAAHCEAKSNLSLFAFECGFLKLSGKCHKSSDKGG